VASSEGPKVDRKEIQAVERNSSWQGQPTLGWSFWVRLLIPLAGCAQKGKEDTAADTWRRGWGEKLPKGGNGQGLESTAY
jgi:hypothetical protein